ncbi:Ku protein [Streptomyces mirabilis]|uniref:Ku protein n=1 Tax=Streptomyces mirabilis TaxID=68239 RepID=UPI003EC07917
MARSIWTGVITFGLASLPVGLYTATEDHTVHFHQLQRGTAARIRSRRVNERTGRDVPSDNIVKGYELTEGDVEPDELDQIAPGRSQTIDITDFVDLTDIEPVYFDRTYYVAPRGEEYTKVYNRGSSPRCRRRRGWRCRGCVRVARSVSRTVHRARGAPVVGCRSEGRPADLCRLGPCRWIPIS